MDPNATLAEIRELIKEDDRPQAERMADLERAAELMAAFDEWICSGGFLPDAWTKPVSGPEPSLFRLGRTDA